MALSVKLSFLSADTTPKIKPIQRAIPMADIANTNVFGNVSPKTLLTFLPCFVNDSLK